MPTRIIDLPTERSDPNFQSVQVDPLITVNKLSTLLQDENTRKTIEDILYSYKIFDKTTIINRRGLLRDNLGSIIGDAEGTILFNLITKLGQEADVLISLCEDEKGKRILKETNAKFSPIFGGCDSFLENDWFRLSWTTSYDGITKEPILSITIFKRNGEHFHIESKTSTWLLFISHLLRQITPMIEKTKEGKADKQFLDLIDSIKKDMNTISSKFSLLDEKA